MTTASATVSEVPPWTVQRMLTWITERFVETGLDGARLQAELLLAHVLGTDRLHLYMNLAMPLEAAELEQIHGLVERRLLGQPLQHLTGAVHFYGRLFTCDRRALIPRPETEVLVETCLGETPTNRDVAVLDLCCGSGIVGLSILAELPRSRADLADLSNEACALAVENVARLGLGERARVHRGDLWSPFPEEQQWDAIVANPPYVETQRIPGLAVEVRDHDPVLALDGGHDGLLVIRRIILGAAQRLRPSGFLALEIGDDQGARVADILSEAGWVDVRVLPDLTRRDRVVTARR
jgi:release factor glutamine methyltransferase